MHTERRTHTRTSTMYTRTYIGTCINGHADTCTHRHCTRLHTHSRARGGTGAPMHIDVCTRRDTLAHAHIHTRSRSRTDTHAHTPGKEARPYSTQAAPSWREQCKCHSGGPGRRPRRAALWRPAVPPTARSPLGGRGLGRVISSSPGARGMRAGGGAGEQRRGAGGGAGLITELPPLRVRVGPLPA